MWDFTPSGLYLLQPCFTKQKANGPGFNEKLEIILLVINYCPGLKLRLAQAAPKLYEEFRKQEGIV